MKNVIGEAAGEIWRYLSNNGDASFTALKKSIKRNPNELYLALGWLSREGKIEIEPKGKNDIKLHLNE